jgi:NAD(P)-dependent dehydrogenase (short-subunit alcohol dehydrogenase family)
MFAPMSGRRVVLVTGSTDGIGRATARGLAAAGVKVIVHGRSKLKVDATLAQLSDELPGAELEGVSFDLASQQAVRKGAAHILERLPALHVVVNNAGIFATERTVTEDGIELTFAVNHLGHFLLAELLKPRLVESASPGNPSRVINVTSIAHTRGRIHLDDLTLAPAWTGYAAYAQSKLAQVMHAITLAERSDPAKLVAYSLHPGVISTKLLRQGFGPVTGSAVEVGARTQVRLATAESVPDDQPSGSYFSDGVVTPPATTARDARARAALWDASLRSARLGAGDRHDG